MKLWDLTTQHCMQTVVAHQAEIWSMDVDPVGELIFTGSTDGELKAWSIDTDGLGEGVRTNESGEVRTLHEEDSVLLTPKHHSAHKIDQSRRNASTGFASSRISNIIPPLRALPCCAIP